MNEDETRDLPDLRQVPEFRGPRRTLFVFDPITDEWLICAWDGSETCVPAEDVTGFLRHCLLHGSSG